jgi:voltage-gated sodium channel
MAEICRKIVESGWFQWSILGVILLAAVVVGLETYPAIEQEHGRLLHTLDAIILWIFVLEAAIKMAQFGRRPWRYFKDPWNVFDFSIVVICFLPIHAQYAAVMRLARVVRALRLVTAVPKLQLLVGALLKSLPSMGYVGILLGLNFYVYAVLGVFLWRDNDPTHFHDLPTAMLTLFRVVTLEDWTDVMYINMYGSDAYPGYHNITDLPVTPHAAPILAAGYFVSFVMFGTMIMLNLFIGVILSSMTEAQADREREGLRQRRDSGTALSLEDEFAVVEANLDDLRRQLHLLRLRTTSLNGNGNGPGNAEGI